MDMLGIHLPWRVQKNHLLIFSSFLDIWENVEWPRFFGPPCILPFSVVGHCRKLQSLRDTLFGLSMVENPGLTVGIKTLSLVVSVVYLFPVLATISLLPVVVRCHSHLLTLSASLPWSKTPGLPSNCNDICHNVGDISTSGLDCHIAISGCPKMSHLFVDTFFDFDVVENFVFLR